MFGYLDGITDLVDALVAAQASPSFTIAAGNRVGGQGVMVCACALTRKTAIDKASRDIRISARVGRDGKGACRRLPVSRA